MVSFEMLGLVILFFGGVVMKVGVSDYYSVPIRLSANEAHIVARLRFGMRDDPNFYNLDIILDTYSSNFIIYPNASDQSSSNKSNVIRPYNTSTFECICQWENTSFPYSYQDLSKFTTCIAKGVFCMYSNETLGGGGGGKETKRLPNDIPRMKIKTITTTTTTTMMATTTEDMWKDGNGTILGSCQLRDGKYAVLNDSGTYLWIHLTNGSYSGKDIIDFEKMTQVQTNQGNNTNKEEEEEEEEVGIAFGGWNYTVGYVYSNDVEVVLPKSSSSSSSSMNNMTWLWADG
ncbi:hypothetical protein RFI_02817, partial [Reticulomyxa filosa]